MKPGFQWLCVGCKKRVEVTDDENLDMDEDDEFIPPKPWVKTGGVYTRLSSSGISVSITVYFCSPGCKKKYEGVARQKSGLTYSDWFFSHLYTTALRTERSAAKQRFLTGPKNLMITGEQLQAHLEELKKNNQSITEKRLLRLAVRDWTKAHKS